MKAITTALVGVLATLANVAVPSPSAQAASYYRCAAQKKGEYTSSTCTERSAKPKKGHYELVGEREFTAETHSVNLEGPEGVISQLYCRAGADAGVITGPSSDLERLTLTGCTYGSSGERCESVDTYGNGTASGVSGTIVTNLLAGSLLGYGEKGVGSEHREPEAGAVWEQLTSSEHPPYLAEFACGGIVQRISGAVAGVVEDTGTPSASGHISFAAGEGEQALLSEVFNGTEFIPDGGAPSGTLTTLFTRTYQQPIDVAP